MSGTDNTVNPRLTGENWRNIIKEAWSMGALSDLPDVSPEQTMEVYLEAVLTPGNTIHQKLSNLQTKKGTITNGVLMTSGLFLGAFGGSGAFCLFEPSVGLGLMVLGTTGFAIGNRLETKAARTKAALYGLLALESWVTQGLFKSIQNIE